MHQARYKLYHHHRIGHQPVPPEKVTSIIPVFALLHVGNTVAIIGADRGFSITPTDTGSVVVIAQ